MSGSKILIADDEPGIRSLIVDALSRYGHEVQCVENGVDAVVALSQDKFDVAFLDIRMPKGDGITALKEIRKLWPDLKVIMITGCGQLEMIDQSMELGSVACLVKPFSMRDVLGILEVAQAA